MTNPNDRMTTLLSKLGSARVALDGFELRNCTRLKPSAPVVTRHNELLNQVSDARLAVRAHWNEINHGNHIPLPPAYQ